ncbi:hypothetical protein AB0875_12510 [Micromonospora gifhornensis]|uniref:hypothetical protein n=1 Tax=Micromonospora gifhornensis TaxID=84594 RepID=UPI00345273B8
MTFPLVSRVQVAPGVDPASDPAGWTWETVPSTVRPGMRITRGRTDAAGDTQPARCTATVDHMAGLGLRRGWPMRVQVQFEDAWWTRMSGVIDELAPRLVDGSVDQFVVDVRASGVMHRLVKGGQLLSPLSAFLAGSTVLTAWLPLEDSAGATQPEAGLPRQPRASATAVQFGVRDEALPGAGTVARLESPRSQIVLPVPPADLHSGGAQMYATASWYWTCGSLGSTPVDVASIALYGSAVARLRIQANETGLTTRALDSSGTELDSLFSPWQDGAHPSEGWIGIQVQLDRPSLLPAMMLRTYVHGVGQTTWTMFEKTVSVAGGFNGYRTVTCLPAGGSSWSHLTVVNQPDAPPNTAWPASGYVGESATARLTRACATAGVQLAPVGATGTAMGPQPQGTLLEVLRDVESADGGLLYEDRLGRMAYQPRISRYNRPVALAASYGQLSPPLEPTDDDRYTRNDWTLSRSAGGSARHIDERHIARYGRYDDAASINVTARVDLERRAQWRVHLGTVEDMRYPVVTLLLHAPEVEPLLSAWLLCDIGSRITIGDVPRVLGGVIDQHIEGYTETLTTFTWQVELAGAPTALWSVLQIADPVYGRVDTAVSRLAADAVAGDTTLLVATAAPSRPWITTASRPQDLPLMVSVDGMPVQVDGIDGEVSPQVFHLAAPLTEDVPVGVGVRVSRQAVAL